MNVLEKLTINTDLVRRVLVAFIREELGKFGFQRAVVGISGGVDSSLTCFLAVEALGPQNVLGVMLPYRTSDPRSLTDAQRVAEMLGIPTFTFEITPMVEPLIQRFPDMDEIRRGNLMARARMMVLYDQSKAFNGLVIGASNKTETLLGYFTLWGDAAAAIKPLADLYKCQVRQLARAVGIPEDIVTKPPSADLWLGQTDEGELGFTYDQADQVLYLWVDERRSEEEIIALGFPPTLVRRIIQRVRDTHFKRHPPIVAKVSHRTVEHDFLYVRDWGR